MKTLSAFTWKLQCLLYDERKTGNTKIFDEEAKFPPRFTSTIKIGSEAPVNAKLFAVSANQSFIIICIETKLEVYLALLENLHDELLQ